MFRYQIRIPHPSHQLPPAVVAQLWALLSPSGYLGEMRLPDETAFLWRLPISAYGMLITNPTLFKANVRVVRDRQIVPIRESPVAAGSGSGGVGLSELSALASAKGVGIAIIDPDGVKGHPAYEGRFQCFDAQDEAEDPVPTTPDAGDDGHGTHMAGVAAGIGCTSPTQDARIYSIRARYAWQMEKAIRWAASGKYPIRVACIASVAIDSNLLDSIDEIDDLHNAIRDALKANVVCCVAAGNLGEASAEDRVIKSPGNAPEAITVGGSSGTGVDAGSSYGPADTTPPIPDLVLDWGPYDTAAQVGNGTEPISGTSMSAAYMSGLVATWYKANPGLQATAIQAILATEGVCAPLFQSDRAPFPRIRQGLGELDPAKAFQVAKDWQPAALTHGQGHAAPAPWKPVVSGHEVSAFERIFGRGVAV